MAGQLTVCCHLFHLVDTTVNWFAIIILVLSYTTVMFLPVTPLFVPVRALVLPIRALVLPCQSTCVDCGSTFCAWQGTCWACQSTLIPTLVYTVSTFVLSHGLVPWLTMYFYLLLHPSSFILGMYVMFHLNKTRLFRFSLICLLYTPSKRLQGLGRYDYQLVNW